jgi:hypothetical protein
VSRPLAPMRAVAKAYTRAGNTGLANFKSTWWELHLECGHKVERNVRWLPPRDGSPPARGFAALHHPPSRDRLPEPPKRARCWECLP